MLYVFWNLKFLYYILRFFEKPLQKDVKSRVFGFSKKRKIRILKLGYGLTYACFQTSKLIASIRSLCSGWRINIRYKFVH